MASLLSQTKGELKSEAMPCDFRLYFPGNGDLYFGNISLPAMFGQLLINTLPFPGCLVSESLKLLLLSFPLAP